MAGSRKGLVLFLRQFIEARMASAIAGGALLQTASWPQEWNLGEVFFKGVIVLQTSTSS